MPFWENDGVRRSMKSGERKKNVFSLTSLSESSGRKKKRQAEKKCNIEIGERRRFSAKMQELYEEKVGGV